jgi:hypothetical protein
MKVLETNIIKGSLIETYSKSIGDNSDGFRIVQTMKGNVVETINASAEINFGNISNADLGLEDFSISFYIKTTYTNIYKLLYGKRWRGTQSNTQGWDIELHQGDIFFLLLGADSSKSVQSNTQVADGKWHHIIITGDRDGNATIYIDNVSDATGSINGSGTVSSDNDFMIQYSSIPSTTYLGDIKIYNHILTETERNKLYSEFLNSRPLGVAKRNFRNQKPNDLSNENGLGVAFNFESPIDISGNGRDYYQNYSFSPLPIKVKDGMYFNGVNNSISFNLAFTNKPNIMMAFTPENEGVYQFIFQGNGNNVRFAIQTDGTIILTSNYSVTTTNTVKYGELNTLVFYSDDTGGYVMLNGVKEALTLVSLDGLDYNAVIGAYNVYAGGSFWFKGIMHDFRQYNRTLTEAEAINYHNKYASQVSLLEYFNYEGADGVAKLPTGWLPGTGDYKIGEYCASSEGDLVKYDSAEDMYDASVLYNFGTNYWLKGVDDEAILTYVDNTNGGYFRFRDANGILSEDAILGNRYKIRVYAKADIVTGTPRIVTQSFGTGGITVHYLTTDYEWYEFEQTCTDNNLGFLYFGQMGAGDKAYLKYVTFEEVPPTIKTDTKYLECDSAGLISTSNDVSYGTWEFDILKGNGVNNTRFLIFNDVNDSTISNGYVFDISSAEDIYFYSRIGGAFTPKFNTASNYIENNIWYRIKITRTSDGVFTIYIKGGLFGETYVLVDTSGGSGSNPFTDTTTFTPKYILLDFDDGDKITNIKITKGVT